MYKTWLRDSLDRLGPKKTRSGLARHLGKSPAFVTRILDYGQKIPADMLPQIASYLGVGIPPLVPGADYLPSSTVDVPVEGVLAMGHWVEQGAARVLSGPESVPAMPDPRYASRRHYSLLVGTSEVVELSAGDNAVFVDCDGDVLIDGQIVHIVTTTNGKEEHIARRVRILGGKTKLTDDMQSKGKKTHHHYDLAANQRVAGILVAKYRRF